MKKLPKSLTTVTFFSKTLAVLIFFLFILGAFREGMKYQSALDKITMQPRSELVITPTLSPQPDTSLHAITITEQDNGQTLQAKVGDKVIVQLAGNVNWNVKLSNTSVLHVAPDGIMYTQPTQGRYKAITPGEVEITATGSPICGKGKVCPMFLIAFRTTLVVSQ